MSTICLRKAEKEQSNFNFELGQRYNKEVNQESYSENESNDTDSSNNEECIAEKMGVKHVHTETCNQNLMALIYSLGLQSLQNPTESIRIIDEVIDYCTVYSLPIQYQFSKVCINKMGKRMHGCYFLNNC